MATTFDSTLAGLGINRTGTTDVKTITRADQQKMGQDDFLQLMTAQLKNQDPFSPVDNTQMVAQMAQFSSLAGITEMSSTLKAIADKLGGTTMGDALGWAGKTVLTEGSVAFPRATGGLEGGVELDKPASDVTVTISDMNGGVLKTISLGAQKAGTANFDWDGKTEAGDAAGNGPFKVSVAASDGAAPVTARGLVWSPVASVSLSNGEPMLTLPGIGQIKTSAVRSVG
ncbi:flagellar hook assembly protein FlgD [Sphingomonas yantingensis]|uniref:Basal-body rod modification protein FlgD n=1 Tax=Sphingomonas yantingensis TaxID=1241761 RepID=A0A7W9EIV9_9SPHN|nr:flagellar hook capping FlgD N-terminal domain-containing protein [Sphingomonas yantingensis]MBB5698340.1 flagellar basal-body rod modification protein FlgD [Sphingomonas yantingensis]